MAYVIDSKNFTDILQDIKNSKERLFDFSGTNFEALGYKKSEDIFVALSQLKQPFTLRLNDCIISNRHNDPKYVTTLTLFLATTPQIETIELRRAVLSKEVLLALAKSLARNHAVNNIHVDGFRATPESGVKVIPQAVREDLLKNPKTEKIFIDGLDATIRKNKHPLFFSQRQPNQSKEKDTPDLTGVKRKISR